MGGSWNIISLPWCILFFVLFPVEETNKQTNKQPTSCYQNGFLFIYFLVNQTSSGKMFPAPTDEFYHD